MVNREGMQRVSPVSLDLQAGLAHRAHQVVVEKTASRETWVYEDRWDQRDHQDHQESRDVMDHKDWKELEACTDAMVSTARVRCTRMNI